MKKLAIIGAGELGKQILNFALLGEQFDVVGFYDDTISNGSEVESNCKVLGDVSDVASQFEQGVFDCLLLAIGYKHMNVRQALFNQFSKEIPFATLIHESCIIDPSAKIGQGSVLYPACVLDKNVAIGENVLLNLGVTVAHDSTIGAHSFIAPRAVLSGCVKIESLCFVGTATVFKDNINIAAETVLGAGTVVNRSLNQAGTYVGNPARLLDYA